MTIVTLLKKELLEAWRDKKLIWLPVVLCCLAISQPISLYFMPQILEMAGNLPEGTVINMPTPTGKEVLIGTISQFSMIGTIIFVIGMMGAIVHERNSGVLSLIMARPVRAIDYIGSKFLSYSLLYVLSFTISYGLAYYYTNLLFSKVEFHLFMASLLIYLLWILFVVSITLIVGTLLNKPAGIAGGSLLIIGGLALFTSFFPKLSAWSPTTAQYHANEIILNGALHSSFYSMIIFTIVILLLLFFLTTYFFKKYESY